MNKAGGIIGIIAGILGFFAAIVTLFFGGLGSAFDADGASTVIGLGWGGVLFSFLTIVFAAVELAKPKAAGIFLIISAILGAILGGTLVAVCMGLALIGGILAVVGARKNIQPSSPRVDAPLSQNSTADAPTAEVTLQEAMPTPKDAQEVVPTQKKKMIWIWAVAGVLLIVVLAVMAAKNDVNKKAEDPIAALYNEHPINIQPYGELASIFNMGSDYTDLQRENKLNEIKGKVVEWSLPVYEVSRSGDVYKIQTKSGFGILGPDPVGTFVYITPRDAAERQVIERMKSGDVVKFRGRIASSSFRSLIIRPAVLYRPATAMQTTTKAPTGEKKDTRSPFFPFSETALVSSLGSVEAIGPLIRAEGTDAEPNINIYTVKNPSVFLIVMRDDSGKVTNVGVGAVGPSEKESEIAGVLASQVSFLIRKHNGWKKEEDEEETDKIKKFIVTKVIRMPKTQESLGTKYFDLTYRWNENNGTPSIMYTFAPK